MSPVSLEQTSALVLKKEIYHLTNILQKWYRMRHNSLSKRQFFRLVPSEGSCGRQKTKVFVSERLENSAGEKGENVGNQHLLLFPQCFLKPSYNRVVKNGDCVLTN